MNIFRSILILFIFCCSGDLLIAQGVSADTGKIEIVQDFKIKELMAKHIEVNSKSSIKGYRIKIHSSPDRSKASEIKAKFRERFPDVPAYGPIYDQPNYNIRIGDFRTKLEAYKFLKDVQEVFPAAFIVVDEIEFPKIE